MAKRQVAVLKEPSPAPSDASSASSSSSSSASSSGSKSNAPSSDRDASSASPSPAQQQQSRSREDVTLDSLYVNVILLKYKPPKGFKLVQTKSDKSPVDWTDIQSNPDLELWAVRVPDNVKVSTLDGLVLKVPDSSSSAEPLITFKPGKSSTEYDVLLADRTASKSLGKRKREDTAGATDDNAATAINGGSEMQSFVALLPKHSAAPRAIVKSLVVTRHLPINIASKRASSSLIASQPSPVPGAILTADELLLPNVVAEKRIVREQPAGLKMRASMPGLSSKANVSNLQETTTMDVDERPLSPKKHKREEKVDAEADADSKKQKKDKKDKKEKKDKKDKKRKE
ncbi:hypothetical protein OIV83_001360 [Microbotryomycetes sp. JL201]|nr:hypothetical protein OIV83_001360 [Microbotryomycetes sp. JL201]